MLVYTIDRFFMTVQEEKKIAFLDRDGVINHDFGYVYRPQDLIFLPWLVSGLLELKKLNYKLYIVTNQSGIARGFFNEGQFHAFMQTMLRELRNRGVEIDGYEFCPHHRDGTVLKYKLTCNCRKPGTLMLDRIFAREKVDPNCCIIIGDKMTDVEAGIRAGVGAGFLIGEVQQSFNNENFYQVNDWQEIINHLPIAMSNMGV